MRAPATAAAAIVVGANMASPSREKQMPTRLSIEPNSPFYDRDILRKVGVRLDGRIRDKDVVEFDSKAGWIKVLTYDDEGKAKRDETGRLVTNKLTGVVETYWKGLAPTIPVDVPKLPAAHFQSAADAKRARRAAKLQAAAEKGGIAQVVRAPVEEPEPKKVRKPRAKKVTA